jgi:uncharacterized protein (DUF983 family)
MEPKVDWDKLSNSEKEEIKRRENPDNLPTGHYTGRCKRCGSSNMWEDFTAYGCNVCDALYVTG